MVGKRDECFGKFVATHLNGAHHKIKVQYLFYIVVDVAVIFQDIYDGGIEVTLLPL